MNTEYFDSITKCYKFAKKTSSDDPVYTRNHHFIHGSEMKDTVGHHPVDTIERMSEGAKSKYTRTLNNIIGYIDRFVITSKSNASTVKYQTLGWKQAKEIKQICDSRDIKCEIVEDNKIERKKLNTIGIWHDTDGSKYSTDTRDNGREELDFHYRTQKVVYVKISK